MKYHWHFIAGTTGTWLILTYINTYRETSGSRWPRNAWFSLQSSGAHWTCQTLVSRRAWSASVSCGSSLTLLSALQAKKKVNLWWLLCVRGRKTNPAAAEAFERPVLVIMYLTNNGVYSRPMNLPSSVSFYIHLFTKSCSLKEKALCDITNGTASSLRYKTVRSGYIQRLLAPFKQVEVQTKYEF